MKIVYIIHGCPSNNERAMSPERRSYNKHWMPWIKKELESRGIKVEIPLMPEPWLPSYEKFKSKFEKYEINEDDVLVGHSCGCAFLVRWLGNSKKKIKKLILVAPWKKSNEDDGGFRDKFYNYPIDETIKLRVEEVVIFTADNEGAAGKESAKIFHKALGGNLIELKGRGHYTRKDMGTEEFPELLSQIIS
jgi:uncharacterized protein